MSAAEPARARHVAIIMDGNGRWAKKRLLPRAIGHQRGVEAVRRVVRGARELGLEALTLYAFSTENWRRPEDEVSDLMSLMKRFILSDLEEVAQAGVRLFNVSSGEHVVSAVRLDEEVEGDAEAIAVDVPEGAAETPNTPED